MVVGNETLLRGEMSAHDLAARIHEVKAQVSVPVTYADVWEFWLRYSDLRYAVDFVTIHILPYWEDFPLPATLAAAHVDEIRRKVAAAMPGKEIMIGEVGWPSAGRMREGAEPSPSNQARVIGETLALAQRENFRVNVIEAFDQPWKRWLEGPSGRYWGIFDRATSDRNSLSTASSRTIRNGCIRRPPASFWRCWRSAPPQSPDVAKPCPRPLVWPKIAALTFLPAVMFGWTVETVPIESFDLASWLRSLAFAATAAAAPIVCAAALRRRPRRSRSRCPVRPDRRAARSAGLGARRDARRAHSACRRGGAGPGVRSALPRHAVRAADRRRLAVSRRRGAVPRAAGGRAMAETVAAGLLALSAVYIVFNESFANWQAVWFCGGLIAFAVMLARARARDVPSSE